MYMAWWRYVCRPVYRSKADRRCSACTRRLKFLPLSIYFLWTLPRPLCDFLSGAEHVVRTATPEWFIRFWLSTLLTRIGKSDVSGICEGYPNEVALHVKNVDSLRNSRLRPAFALAYIPAA